MADISDKAKIRAIGQLVHWMFSHLVNKGVIEAEEALRTIDRMIENFKKGNDEHVQAAQHLELIRTGVWPISRPNPRGVRMPVNLQEIQSLIEQHNAGWIAGDNPISRLSPEERVRRHGAMEPRPAIPFTGHVHYHTGTGLPAHFDYRNIDGKNYVTSVRDQCTADSCCGSCVAFSCVGAIEATISRQQSHHNPTIHLSEAQLFFCYGQQDGANCTTPWWPEKALPHCVNPGLVDDGCFPYTPHDQSCNLCAEWQNRLTKIKSFAKLGSQAAIKDWLVNRGAVVVTMDVYEDFYWYISGVYKHLTGALVKGKHCMACIGYDDSAGCWICKNSWGPDKGEQGFYRIGYGQCRIDSWDVLGVE